MAEEKDPFAEFGGKKISTEKADPFAEFGGKTLKKKDQPISRGFGIGLEPSQPRSVPSPLIGEGIIDYQERERKAQQAAEKLSNKLNTNLATYMAAQGEEPTREMLGAQEQSAYNQLQAVIQKDLGNKGTVAGHLYNRLLQGTGAAISGGIDAGLNLMKYAQPMSPLINEATIIDYRYNIAPDVKNFLREQIGAEVDKGAERKFDEDFITSAVGGLAYSVPAMVTPMGVGLYAQAYDSGLDLINSTEAGKNLTEAEKTLFASALGVTMGTLEKAGLDRYVSRSIAPQIARNTTFKAIKELSEKGIKITPEAIERLAKKEANNIKNRLVNAGDQTYKAFLDEFTTGGLQELGTIGLEQSVNALKNKDIFDTQGMGEMFGRVLKSAAQEGIGGGIMGVAKGAMPVSTRGYLVKEIANAKSFNDVNRLLRDVESIGIENNYAPEQIDDVVSVVNQIVQLKEKLPPQLTSAQQEGILNLIVERNELSDELQKANADLQNIDPAFADSKANEIAILEKQINAINNDIKEISENENYAVQEQTAGQVPVQPEAAISGEVAQGEPQAEPQATAEGVQEKITIGVAPFREINVTSLDQDADLRSTPEYKNYVKNIARISKSLGLKVDQSAETWGGYVDTETGRPVQEVSNMLQIKATPEEAKVLAAILGKTAPEMQDAVLVGSFSENGTGAEHTIRTGSFENATKAIEFLKKNGLEYFTIDKNTGDIIILDLDGSSADNIINFNKELNENGITTDYTAYGVEAEFVGRDDYDGILAEQGRKIAEERGIDIDAIVKSATERFQKTRKQKVEAEPEAELVVLEEQTPKDIASKIRGLKVTLGKGSLQSNIAGLPIALYNSVVEFVATSVEAGSTIAEAIKKAIDKFKLNEYKDFDKNELTRSIEESATPVISKSVKDIDVNKIRTQDRPGKRISKGLSVKTVNKEKTVEESEDLSIEYVKNNAPKVFISNAEKIARYPLVSGVKKFGEIKTESEAQEVYDIFVRQVADNLKYLTGEYNQEFREIATLWYDGANMLANKLSDQYGVSSEQAAGIIAAMSPQKDWYMNVRLAELVMMAYKQNAVLTNDMILKQVEIAKEGEKPFLKAVAEAKKALSESRTKANIEKSIDAQRKYTSNKEKSDKVIEWLKTYVGKDINSVPEAVQPYIVRLHNELNNSKEFNILRPDGEVLEIARTKEGEVKKIAWGSYSEIGKAVSIYNNGSQENITKSLGEMHKIRNFYNNIIDPMSKDGDVTIDTHAVAAALLQPLSGNSKAVGENFGTGTSNSSPLGIKGLYYAYSDAYALAAKELKLLPRQVQSITWEAVRGLFTDTFKRNVAEVKKINDIWKNYENGKITIEQTRRLINESAGGVKDPTWAKPVLSELEGGLESRPVGRGSGVSRPDTVGESSAVRVAAKSLRKLKIDLGKGTAQSNIAGLPIALYNSVIEFIATSIESGATVAEAIKKAIDKFKLNDVKSFDEAELRSIISEAAGESAPTGIVKRPAGKLAKVREGLSRLFRRKKSEVGRAIKPQEFAEFEEVVDNEQAIRDLRDSIETPFRNEEKLEKAAKSKTSRFIKAAFESQVDVINKLLDKGGDVGKIVVATLKNRKGYNGKASIIFRSFNKEIFDDLGFTPNIDMVGRKVSERELFDTFLNLNRIINIDARISDKFARLVQVDRQLKDKSISKEKAKDLAAEKERLETYLKDRNALDKRNGEYIPKQYKHSKNRTAASARAELKLMQSTNPELYNKLDNAYDSYTDAFRFLLEEQYKNNLISKEVYDELFSYNYIPTRFIQHFVMNELSQDNPALSSKLSSSIKNLTGGSDADVITNFQAILELYTNSVYKRIYENRAANSLARAIFATGEQEKGLMKVNQIVKSADADITSKPMYNINLDMFVQEPTGEDKNGNPTYGDTPTGYDVIYFYRDNGKRERIVASKDFVDTWYDRGGLLSPKGEEYLSSLSKVSGVNLFKALITKNNPSFGIFQILMDAPQAIIATQAYPDFVLGSFMLAKDYASVSGDITKFIKDDELTPLFKEAIDAGIFSDFLSTESDVLKSQSLVNPDGSTNYKTAAKVLKRKTTRAFDKTLDSIAKFNEAIEYATRLAVYKRMKENLVAKYTKENGGLPPSSQQMFDIQALAAEQSRGMVDFSRSGTIVKPLNKVLAYLNAGMQAFYSSAKSLKNNPTKAAILLSEIGLGGVAVLAMSLGAWGDEKEKKKRLAEYLMLSKYQRSNYFNLYNPYSDDPEKRWVRWPKPQLFRGWINMLEQGYLNTVMNVDIDENVIKEAFLNDLPIEPDPFDLVTRNPMVNGVVKYGLNKDVFRSQEVVRNAEKIEDWAEGVDDENVAKIYKKLGAVTRGVPIPFLGSEGLSPKRSQAFVESMIGDPSRNTTTAILDKGGRSIFYLATGDTKALEQEFGGNLGDNMLKLSGLKGRLFTKTPKLDNSFMDMLNDQEKELYTKRLLIRAEIEQIYDEASSPKEAKQIAGERLNDLVKSGDIDAKYKKRVIDAQDKLAAVEGKPSWYKLLLYSDNDQRVQILEHYAKDLSNEQWKEVGNYLLKKGIVNAEVTTEFARRRSKK